MQAGQRLRRSQLLVQGGGKRWLTRACFSFAQCVEQVVGVRQNPPLLLISMGWSLQKETKGNVNPSCTTACRSFRYKASKARISVHISTFIHTHMILRWSWCDLRPCLLAWGEKKTNQLFTIYRGLWYWGGSCSCIWPCVSQILGSWNSPEFPCKFMKANCPLEPVKRWTVRELQTNWIWLIHTVLNYLWNKTGPASN
jgi:hypothetical protein